MIDRILDLLKKHNITASKMIADLALPNNVVSAWKKGKSKPSAEVIVKIADYFDVTTDYLLTGKQTTTPEPVVLHNNSTSLEIELLNLFHRFPDKSDQHMFIAGVYDLAMDLENEKCPSTLKRAS